MPVSNMFWYRSSSHDDENPLDENVKLQAKSMTEMLSKKIVVPLWITKKVSMWSIPDLVQTVNL